MLREQFILPQPVKTRPVDVEQPVRESRSSRDSDSRREDFQSTLAATGNERQSGNRRTEQHKRSESRETETRSASHESHAKHADRNSNAKAERNAAIESEIDRHVTNPKTREKLKEALLNDQASVSKSAEPVDSKTSGLEQKFANLLDEFKVDDLTQSEAENLVTQLNNLLESLQNFIGNKSTEQSVQTNLFNQLQVSDELVQQKLNKPELSETINSVLSELVQLLKSKDQSLLANNKPSTEDLASDPSTLSKSLTGDINEKLTTQLSFIESAQSKQSNTLTKLSTLSDLASLQTSTEISLLATASNASAENPSAANPSVANPADNKSVANLTWLNGVLAQAEHAKSSGEASQGAQSAGEVAKAQTNSAAASVQSLIDMAKMALDNAKLLNLSDSQIDQIKATLANLGSVDKNNVGTLSAAQQQLFNELAKLIEQGPKHASPADNAPINQAFKLTNQQNPNASIQSATQSNNLASQQTMLENNMRSALNIEDSAVSSNGEGGKFKLAEQIQLQAATSTNSLSQPTTDSAIKTQTVEVQGVQLDRTLQAPKMENISNIRHDAMIKENILFNKQELANAMQQQVGLMMARNLKSVDIRLDPPELGSMQVRLNIGAEAASVNFVVSSQQAKDALEGSLPKLREMLEQQGLELADSNVKKDNSQNGQAGEGENELHGQSDGRGRDGEESELNGAADSTRIAYQIDSPYKIDFYA